MGSDDLHKKRKAREAKDFERKQAEREMFSRCLVVCEGETETYYLQDLASYLELNTRRVQILKCPRGTDPLSIADYALKYAHDQDFDTIWCVCDGIGATTFSAAIKLVEEAQASNLPIRLVPSYPCFEIWILMHYSSSTKPYTSCDELLVDLLKRLPDYKKAQRGLFDKTQENIQTAIKNSNIILKSATEIGNPNPSTTLHDFDLLPIK